MRIGIIVKVKSNAFRTVTGGGCMNEISVIEISKNIKRLRNKNISLNTNKRDCNIHYYFRIKELKGIRINETF